MNVLVNDETREVGADATCRDLVAELTGRVIGDDGRAQDGAPLGIALALDGAVVPRSAWSTTSLAHGSRVEVVTAVQGG